MDVTPDRWPSPPCGWPKVTHRCWCAPTAHAGQQPRPRTGARSPQPRPGAPIDGALPRGGGWQDRIKPGHLVGAIANESGLDGRQIGKITIFDDYSTVDLPQGMPPELMKRLQGVRVMQKELRISRQPMG